MNIDARDNSHTLARWIQGIPASERREFIELAEAATDLAEFAEIMRQRWPGQTG